MCNSFNAYFFALFFEFFSFYNYIFQSNNTTNWFNFISMCFYCALQRLVFVLLHVAWTPFVFIYLSVVCVCNALHAHEAAFSCILKIGNEKKTFFSFLLHFEEKMKLWSTFFYSYTNMRLLCCMYSLYQLIGCYFIEMIFQLFPFWWIIGSMGPKSSSNPQARITHSDHFFSFKFLLIWNWSYIRVLCIGLQNRRLYK